MRRPELQLHPIGVISSELKSLADARGQGSEGAPDPVTVRSLDGHRLRIDPIEALDGTPVVDIKPVLR